MPARRTLRQRAASRKNLEKARAARAQKTRALPSTMLYHSTTRDRAGKILKEGFKWSGRRNLRAKGTEKPIWFSVAAPDSNWAWMGKKFWSPKPLDLIPGKLARNSITGKRPESVVLSVKVPKRYIHKDPHAINWASFSRVVSANDLRGAKVSVYPWPRNRKRQTLRSR